MDKLKAIIDGVEYTPDQFRRDAVRMFDYYRRRDSDYMGRMDCKNVRCNDCPLNNKGCNTTKLQTFESIKTVYEWAKTHPVITNRDKLKEVFNVELTKEYELFLSYMRPTPNPYGDPFYYFGEEWINKSIEEWKDPKKK